MHNKVLTTNDKVNNLYIYTIIVFKSIMLKSLIPQLIYRATTIKSFKSTINIYTQ